MANAVWAAAEGILGNNRNPLTRAEVVEAASHCIERFGVAKTSMKDVAAYLGVTRQTVHRLFESRSELIEAVADVRIERLSKILKGKFVSFPDVATALIEGSLLSLSVGATDPVLVDIQTHADHSVDQFMFRGSPSVQAAMVDLWGPVIDRAREEGILQPGITTEAAVEWIRNIHAMLAMRSDYDEALKTQTLRQFVLPSLLTQY